MNLVKRSRLWILELIRIIRSYYFCFKYLPYETAKKMPIFIDYPIKVHNLKRGGIIIKGNVSPKQIWFGQGVAGLSEKPTCIDVQNGGQIEFSGSAFFAKGCVLRVDQSAILKIGDKVGFNCNCFIRCGMSIRLGDELLMGWNNEISDCDGHDIWLNNTLQPQCKSIIIGNHVWITSYVKIGKGVEIADDCVVAKSAVVVKSHTTTGSLIGGVPAKTIHNNIKWKK